jgi:hypothetical protein
MRLAVVGVYRLWIGSAWIVRKTHSVSRAEFHANARTGSPQLLQRGGARQVRARKAESDLSRDGGLLY